MTDVFSSLPPAIAERMRAVVAQRENAGLNVHFLNERGERDRFSFASAERAEAFKAKLMRQGRTILEN